MSLRSLLAVTLLAVPAAVACSATPVVVNTKVEQSQTATSQSKSQTVAKLDTLVHSTTPPAGATPASNAPTTVAGHKLAVGTATIYAFELNVDADADAETLSWVATNDAVIVWGTIGLECVDEAGKATGEKGEADFVYERTANGKYGWFTGTGACGYTTKFGCSGDTSGEVCGGCDYNDDFVQCVALAQ